MGTWGGGTAGSAVASRAESYVGRFHYRFGGAPASGGSDCSGFVNMVVGWRLGLAIPGYKAGDYKGQTHGPTVLQWAAWPGCSRVTRPAPGDLAVWPGPGPLGHIGIVTGPDQMVSALSPSKGTASTLIRGVGPPVPVTYRRLQAVRTVTAATSYTAAAAGASASSCAAASGAGFVAWLIGLLAALALAASVPAGGPGRARRRPAPLGSRP